MEGSCDSKRVERSLRLPACLIIMDGFGLGDPGDGNAISLAQTPVLDELFKTRPWIKLEASGEAVGLPEGQMGNSEVGHLNIGAGRIVYQELTRINKACEDGSIKKNPIIQSAFDTAKKPNSALHLMGLLSDGGVHSSNKHLYALLEAAASSGVSHIYVHCFLDGRDVPPTSGAGFVQELTEEIASLEGSYPDTRIEIATIEGRYYAMDRDNRWDRVRLAYETIVCAANQVKEDPVSAVKLSYGNDVTDEFVVPMAFQSRGIEDGDSVIFFNFRPDRARQISHALTDVNFEGFERCSTPKIDFVCLTEYDPSIDAPVAFAKTFPKNVLADVLVENGLTQFHIAETEKYAHVTFFLNGGIEQPKPGESRLLIKSPDVTTYDLKPEMSEPEVTDELVRAIDEDAADVYIVNFANCDMVGHTGVIPAAVCAVEAVDSGVGKVLAAMKRKGGITLITADHGNADKMLDSDGKPYTAHTTALVPFILVDESEGGLLLKETQGRLADIAPTLLKAIGISVPSEMTGNCLLAV